MITKHVAGLALTVLVWMLPAGGAAAAEGQPAAKDGPPEAAKLADLLKVVDKLPLPSFAGLIKPERLGVLTDNQCRIQDNQTQLLSNNAADVDLLSGNQVNILSGLHLLSDISVEIHITIHSGGEDAAGAAKPAKDKPKSSKARKRQARQRS